MANKTELYRLDATSSLDYKIRKFNEDFELQSEWDMSLGPHGPTCRCWQGAKGLWCRHQEMWPEFQGTGHINDGYFLDRATGMWLPPLAT